MALTPRDEQEIILNYDREAGKWHYYSDVPTFNRKYIKFINIKRKKVEKNGIISMLEGTIEGGKVAINKNYKMSEAEREKRSRRASKNLQGR